MCVLKDLFLKGSIYRGIRHLTSNKAEASHIVKITEFQFWMDPEILL